MPPCTAFAVNVKVVADGTVRGCNGNVGFMVSTFTDLILRVAFVFILTPPARFCGRRLGVGGRVVSRHLRRAGVLPYDPLPEKEKSFPLRRRRETACAGVAAGTGNGCRAMTVPGARGKCRLFPPSPALSRAGTYVPTFCRNFSIQAGRRPNGRRPAFSRLRKDHFLSLTVNLYSALLGTPRSRAAAFNASFSLMPCPT
mgnify:FL=1